MAAQKKKKKTYKLDRKPGLYLQQTPDKGRGVFCLSDIAAGETLEVTPAIILDKPATAHADKTILCNYTFTVGKVSKRMQAQYRLKQPEKGSCVIMGIMAFCNHDEKPNAEIQWEERDGTAYHLLKATRRIPKGTEICTSYGEGWFEDRA